MKTKLLRERRKALWVGPEGSIEQGNPHSFRMANGLRAIWKLSHCSSCRACSAQRPLTGNWC